jgi:hypothetical protein
MDVRKCNAEITLCAWAVAKATSRMTLIDADKNRIRNKLRLNGRGEVHLATIHKFLLKRL